MFFADAEKMNNATLAGYRLLINKMTLTRVSYLSMSEVSVPTNAPSGKKFVFAGFHRR